MDEFLKVNWGRKDLLQLEQEIKQPFLKDELIDNSYIFSNTVHTLTTKISTSNERKDTFVPGKVLQKSAVLSSLNKAQQARCLVALMTIQKGNASQKLTDNDMICMETYQKFQAAIIKENSEFLEDAKKQWLNRKQKKIRISPSLLHYGSRYIESQASKFFKYPQYYKEIGVVSLLYTEAEAPVEVNLVQNLLELGSLAAFTPPTLTSQFILKPNSLLTCTSEVELNYKSPVSEDVNVMEILTTNSIDVVISSSSLKRLMDASTNNSWNIPVIIKYVDMKKENGMIVKKKVVFFDKTVPNTKVNVVDLSEKCHKQLVKSNFCKIESFVYPKMECSASKSEVQNQSVDKIHPNVSYRIWNMKLKDEQCDLMKTKSNNVEMKVLVRCKLDACEVSTNGSLSPLLVVPKLEYQLAYGGNIPTRSELSREWTSLFFRPYSTLYRVRINVKNSEVVLIEKCTMQKINNEAFAHYKYKPHLGLGVLYKVFLEMTKLECGKYLLHHEPKQGFFAAVCKEASASETNIFDFHEALLFSVDKDYVKPWSFIDVKLILPEHKIFKRMPGMFHPHVKKYVQKSNTKGEKKSARKKKQNNSTAS